MRGEEYTPVNTSWEGKNYRTIDDEELRRAENDFAEFTGMLGYMPAYDDKLATLEIARKMYPEDKYDVVAYDMDDDPLTPQNVIVREKDTGRLVAANGYRLAQPNERQQQKRFRKMLYYSENRTADQRRSMKYGKFLQARFGKTSKSKGYQPIVKYMTQIFGQYMGINSGRQPILFKVLPIQSMADAQLNVYAETSLIGWNTILSRMARLYLDMYLWKLIHLKEKS